MKRYGNLWHQVIDFSNLLQAARNAQKGKRFRDNVLAFNHNLEAELIQLQLELETKTYIPGSYKTFQIRKPKRRLISAAPYRDRVVHHALCNIIAPILEKGLILNTYANRLGFGSHRALQRFTRFVRNHDYILQCDISKYFPSIDHEILKSLIRRKIKCLKTLWLIDTIIDASNPQESVIHYFSGDDLLTPVQRRVGLPIGNLTSQFFANFYLSGFDHFVKETLKVKPYIRYVDDFAFLSNDRAFLADVRIAVEDYLSTLRLKIHPIKSQLFATKIGTNFLGFRVFLTHIRVRNQNLRYARKRLKTMQDDYAEGTITPLEIQQSLQSWAAHLKHGDTWQLRKQIFSDLAFVRHRL
ncbi:MAG: RNA-directed DNA polymerase [Oculatellaceae cyanobacterium bins.114]|nr:RNA-directed DNA polymerase [Oculatellaceae cyanobacterium bins.114]